jgi:hypothetical protein
MCVKKIHELVKTGLLKNVRDLNYVFKCFVYCNV